MMHAVRYGAGANVYVGVHGWGGSHATFLPLAPHVPAGATLYAVDLPGYGRSPRIPVTTSGIAGEIARFIEALDVQRVTLVGNCSGAILGLLAHDMAPARVARHVLIDPFAFLPWYFKVFVQKPYGRIAYQSTFANPVGRWITNLSLKNRRKADTDLTGSFRAVDHEVSLEYLEMLDAIDGIARFGGIRVPIDIVYGERTFAAVKQSVVQWQSLWPHARAWQVPGTGHLPIEEAPARLAAIAFGSSDDAGGSDA